jgi:hypothetical protein
MFADNDPSFTAREVGDRRVGPRQAAWIHRIASAVADNELEAGMPEAFRCRATPSAGAAEGSLPTGDPEGADRPS